MLKEILEGSVESAVTKDLEKALSLLNDAGMKAKKLKDGKRFNDVMGSIYSKIEEEVMYVQKGEYS